MYKILLDQNKLFECDITIEGASPDNTQTRLMLETDTFSICFKGEVKNGKVKVPISKLKNILKENVKGTISLEVIADDTFFTPWKETYLTETHRKIEVSFKEDKPLIEESKKPKVTAVVLSENEKHADKIIEILQARNLKLKDLAKNPKIVTEALGIYLTKKNIPVQGNLKTVNEIINIVVNKAALLK